MKAGIVDYQMGNLASVSKAIESIGASSCVSTDVSALADSDLLVVPGVGNFKAGIEALRRDGLDDFIIDWALEDRPLIGICLGMQVLFGRSEEGDSKGLGIVPGQVLRLRGDEKVPHMGWNEISSKGSSIFDPFDKRRFYFVHSYVCVPDSGESVATTNYGSEFVSGIHVGNICGVQFHPEKSSIDGLALMKRMVEVLVD